MTLSCSLSKLGHRGCKPRRLGVVAHLVELLKNFQIRLADWDMEFIGIQPRWAS